MEPLVSPPPPPPPLSCLEPPFPSVWQPFPRGNIRVFLCSCPRPMPVQQAELSLTLPLGMGGGGRARGSREEDCKDRWFILRTSVRVKHITVPENTSNAENWMRASYCRLAGVRYPPSAHAQYAILVGGDCMRRSASIVADLQRHKHTLVVAEYSSPSP